MTQSDGCGWEGERLKAVEQSNDFSNDVQELGGSQVHLETVHCSSTFCCWMGSRCFDPQYFGTMDSSSACRSAVWCSTNSSPRHQSHQHMHKLGTSVWLSEHGASGVSLHARRGVTTHASSLRTAMVTERRRRQQWRQPRRRRCGLSQGKDSHRAALYTWYWSLSTLRFGFDKNNKRVVQQIWCQHCGRESALLNTTVMGSFPLLVLMYN